MQGKWLATVIGLGLLGSTAAYCAGAEGGTKTPVPSDSSKFRTQPLVPSMFFADPSAHVFNGKVYVYPSHDIPNDAPNDDLGSQYGMRDYRVLTMDRPGGKVTVNGVALDVSQVPWAKQQMWAPDAAYKNGIYYLYFPARDHDNVFRIGVATSRSPIGPFKAEPKPIEGSFSIDPAVFMDDDGQAYMYFGGIWGGQLQRWATGSYNAAAGDTDLKTDDKPALSAKVVKLSSDMKQFAENPRDAVIVDEKGAPLLGGDHDRRFFEGSWMFKRNGVYYFLYSTGDTHLIAYATGKTPYGPFTYRGTVLKPVQGWTSHVSTINQGGSWYLFYHDTQLSNVNSLRSAKVIPLEFEGDGSIRTIDPFK
ncbi:glycoside hydrolase family 43 protein [Sphingomonas sp.]|uniref:glycoside hydrolase family 43 protein n=1 Tax=Sphingomonas sp. TaxID=28214 RepID=UPI000DB51EBC|nr:glycoside hydrolase family 43 protein [Sphingomonas sp.]PZU08856.1 MAG: alpha-N-arabinofuranosidase [Sphingomonas sp.]